MDNPFSTCVSSVCVWMGMKTSEILCIAAVLVSVNALAFDNCHLLNQDVLKPVIN